MSQILYLNRNHKFPDGKSKRKAKHIRHCFRLLDTGRELLETGHITMPLKDPQKYIEISKITDDTADAMTDAFAGWAKDFWFYS